MGRTQARAGPAEAAAGQAQTHMGLVGLTAEGVRDYRGPGLHAGASEGVEIKAGGKLR